MIGLESLDDLEDSQFPVMIQFAASLQETQRQTSTGDWWTHWLSMGWNNCSMFPRELVIIYPELHMSKQAWSS